MKDASAGPEAQAVDRGNVGAGTSDRLDVALEKIKPADHPSASSVHTLDEPRSWIIPTGTYRGAQLALTWLRAYERRIVLLTKA